MLTCTVRHADRKKWEKAMQRLVTLDGVQGVRVGIPAGATSEEGESIAQYAVANEYGNADIPARPFLRTTQQRELANWAALFSRATQGRWITDKNVAERAFAMLGGQAVADVRDTIMSNMPPPNAADYAASKAKKHGGYGGTLYDSGDMFRAVTYELVKS